jgi:O-antigen ligase
MKDRNSGSILSDSMIFPHREGVERSVLPQDAFLPARVGFFCILMLVAITATPFGMANPLWEVILTCSIFLLAALKITGEILHGKGGWGEYKMVFAPFLCLLIFSFIQTIQLKTGNRDLAGLERNNWWALSFDPSETRRFAFKLLAFMLFGYLILRYTNSQRRLLMLAHFTLCLGVASALLGIAQQAIGKGPEWLFPYVGYERAYGQFGNRNHFAFLMEMTLGLGLGLIARRGEHRKYLGPYLAAVTIICLGLILTSSRGGVSSMLGMFLVAAVALLIGLPARETQDKGGERAARRKGKVRIGGAVMLGVSLALIFLAVVWIGGDRLADRFERTGSDLTEQEGAANPKEARSKIWSATLKMIEARPLLGVGFGGYATAIPKYHEDTGELIPYEAHNEYLELQASGGVIGSILFFWFIAELFKRARSALRSSRSFSRAATFGALVGLFGVALHSLVDSGLHITLNILVFVILIMLVVVKIPRTQEIPIELK